MHIFGKGAGARGGDGGERGECGEGDQSIFGVPPRVHRAIVNTLSYKK